LQLPHFLLRKGKVSGVGAAVKGGGREGGREGRNEAADLKRREEGRERGREGGREGGRVCMSPWRGVGGKEGERAGAKPLTC